MLNITPLKTSASATALVCALTTGLLASTAQADDYVQSMSFSAGGIYVIGVKNMSANKSLGALNLQPTASSIKFGLNGSVNCKNGSRFLRTDLHFQSKHNWADMDMGYGGAFLNEGLYVKNKLHFQPGFQGAPQNKAFNYNWTVPLNAVKTGNGAFNPVAIIEEMKNEFVQNGGKAIDFYKKNRVKSVNVRLSLFGSCYVVVNNIVESSEDGYGQAHVKSISVPVTVAYKGDPALFSLNAQLSQGGNLNIQKQPKPPVSGGNNIQAGYQPLAINQAFITANVKDYVGSCPKTLNFGVRMRGIGKGMVQYRIVNQANETQKVSPYIFYDGKDGWKQHNFTFSVQPNPNKINQKTSRKFRLFFKLRDFNATEFDWSPHGEYTGLPWSVTCTAQLNPQLGNQGQLGVNKNTGPQKQGIRKPATANPPKRKVAPTRTKPATPKAKIAPTRTKPTTPTRKVAPTRTKPTTPKLKIQKKKEDPKPERQIKRN